MKIRLGRGATIAAGAVAASLFVLLCMMFYGREDFLAPEKVLERGDALRFRIAASLVGPLGAGAYLAMGLVFAWSVVAYFRESVGALVPRLVGLAACVPSFCALTSLSSEPHEFWAGSVGIWMGDVAFRGFGPILAWAVVGTLFLVSFALATEFGFYGQLSALRGTLSFPLVPPAEPEIPADQEEPGLPVAPMAPATETALLEPGIEVPAEPWALPDPDLGAGVEEVVGPEDEEFYEIKVVDREEHLADIRRRTVLGEPVTDAERRLLDASRMQSEVGSAIDAVFAPAAPALPDVPPFLLPTPFSQEVALERPAHAAEAATADVPAPEAPAPSGTKHPTEEMDAADRAPAGRGRYVFAGVEFLPPNEELADPHAAAPPEAGRTVIPLETTAPTVVASSVEPAFAAPAPAPAGDPAPASQEFEDEIFAFGIEQEPHASSPAIPAVVADAVSAPIEGDVLLPDDASWLLAAARDLGIEPVADVEQDLAADVEIPARGGLTAEQAASAIVDSLHDLFGEPLRLPVPTEAATPAAPETEAAAGTQLPFMAEEVVVPSHAPPPLPEVVDPTFLPPVSSAEVEGQAETDSPAPESPAPRTYEPEPTTIEPDYIPNQEPEPGEIVKASTEAAPSPEIVEEIFDEPSYVPAEEPLEEEFSSPSDEEQGEAEWEAPTTGPDEVLARLFGEPVPRARVEDSPAPAGPIQPEPREPPANLQPILAETPGKVTLLTDLDLGDCARDHGIEDSVLDEQFPVLDEQIEVGTPHVVDDDGPATVPVEIPAPRPPEPEVEADEEIVIPSVDEALVDSLVADFQAAMPETAPETAKPKAPAGPPADDFYEQAVAAVRERGRGSVIVLQRKLGIGYTRAARLLEQLVADGVLGPENASGSHPVL